MFLSGCRWLLVIPISVGTSFNEGFLVISKPSQIASKKNIRAHNSPKVCFVSPIVVLGTIFVRNVLVFL